MKRLTNLTFAAGMVVALGMFFSSCEGPAGPAGIAGVNGKDGKDGKDANATCTQCHNSSNIIETKTLQLDNSIHFFGSSVDEASRTSCAPCHSSQGYLDVIANPPFYNNYSVKNAPSNPSPVGSCYTCHNIHQAYDSTDWSFTGGAAFNMIIDSTIHLDLGEKANLCARCHQPRPVSPRPNLTTPTATMTIGSYRFGPHYGAQGAIFAGKGAFEFQGSLAYDPGQHAGMACADCHMGSASGIYAGGHTFNMVNEESGAQNVAACATCHSGLKNFDKNGKQTEIEGLFAQLESKLDTLLDKDGTGAYTGYLDIYDPANNPDGRYKNSSTSSFTAAQKTYNTSLPSCTITNTVAAAVVNFMLINKDNSFGVHNYPYTKALLQNTIENLP